MVITCSLWPYSLWSFSPCSYSPWPYLACGHTSASPNRDPSQNPNPYQADSGAHDGRELLTKPSWQEIASSERRDLPQGPNGRGSIASAVGHLILTLTATLTLALALPTSLYPKLVLNLTLALALTLTLSRWVIWCSLSTSGSTRTTTA